MTATTASHGKAKVQPKRTALLLPYQARWARDKSRLKIAEKSAADRLDLDECIRADEAEGAQE